MNRDLNFFEPFLLEGRRREKKEMLSVIPFLVALIVIVSMLGLVGFNFIKIKSLQAQITEADTYLNAPDVQEQVEEINKKEKELESIKEERAFLDKLDTDMKRADTVNERLMNFISKEVIDNMYLTNIQVANREIAVTGKSLTRMGIAQFEYDLRNSGYFEDIYVSQINKTIQSGGDPFKEDFFQFQMVFRAKDTVYDEDNTPAQEGNPLLPGNEENKENTKKEGANK